MRFSATFSSAASPAVVVLALTWGAIAGFGQTFSGRWHLDVAKSSWGTATRPVSVVVIIDHREPVIEYQGRVIYANEESRAFGFVGAFDGKPYPVSRSFGDGVITLHRVDKFTFTSTFHTDDGMYTEMARTSLSRDGKVLTRKLTVQSPDASKTWTEVYNRGAT